MNKTPRGIVKVIKNLSIQHKMMLAISSTCIAVLLMAASLWSYNDWRSSCQAATDNLRVLAGVIGGNVTAALNFRTPEDAKVTLGALRAKPEITSAAAYDSEGKLFASYIQTELEGDWKIPENLNQLPKDRGEGATWLEPVYSGKDFIGTVYVHSNFNDVKDRLMARAQLSLAILGVSILFSFIFALLAQRLLSGPILSLLQTVQRVGTNKSFALRVEKLGNDEIGKLVDGFNDMLSQVEARDRMLVGHREQLEREVKQRTAELQNANNALSESEEKVRTIVESAGDGIIIFDGEGKIISVNRAACEMFTYNPNELVGKSFDIISYESHSPRTGVNITEHLMARARESAVVGREFHGRSSKQRTFPAELTLTRYTVGGKEFFSAILRDITARKEAETQLIRAKEAAETLAQAKTEFLANMSHEIRTPLNGIFGAVQLVAKSTLDADQQELVDILKTSSESLLRIVNDVLEFSKLEAGKLMLEKTEFEVKGGLEAAIASVVIEAGRKKINFTTNIDAKVPSPLIGDPYRLGQVVLNLVHNAIKFTPAEGSVTLTVDTALLSGQSVILHFCVKDTGIGIAPEKRDAIFQAFAQADTSSTRQYGGTGLGLSIATKIVHLMGGDIWVESAKGEGSSFHFTANFELAQVKVYDPSLSLIGTEGSKTSAFASPGLKVLLVEDNPIIQKIALKLLKTLGLTVTTVNNGQEALNILTQRSFHMILMDCQMPVMDGFTATRIIREREAAAKSPRQPIIALTAHAVTGDRERCLKAGMDEYVAKPIVEEMLIDVLEKIETRFNLRKS